MEFIVNKKSLLLEYLEENLDGSRKKVKSYLTHGLVYINHQKITQYNYPLEKGMKITIDTNSKRNFPFPIIYEDDFIIVVDKPSNLLTVATKKEKEKTLYHYVSTYVKSKNKNNKIYIVHRLDKETSGVVLFAKDKNTKDDFQKNWNEYTKNREYRAVVYGVFKKKSNRLVHHLLENKENFVYITSKNEGKQAITNYEVIAENSKYSMLKITIETGRKNQIRVQLASIKHAIVGDCKYSDVTEKHSRLYLHANQLQIFYKNKKKIMTFEACIPDSFSKMIRK